MSSTRTDLRNVAIVAHVDHGKTTLVDAMLRQAGAFAAHQAEQRRRAGHGLRRPRAREGHHDPREEHRGPLRRPGRRRRADDINIIDTPGHADFGGEVERGLSMVDGIVLLVDASEGPLPQTRFVLRKALNADMPVILVVNKIDRARRPDRRGRRRDLRAVPGPARRAATARTRSTSRSSTPPAEAGVARRWTMPENGGLPDSPDLEPLFQTILETIPAPTYAEGAPLQAHVTNLDASPFLGRLALVRVHEGTLRKGQTRRLDASATARSRTSRSPSCSSPRGSSASPASPPAPATSSPSPASPTSRSARPWPTRRTRSRCR